MIVSTDNRPKSSHGVFMLLWATPVLTLDTLLVSSNISSTGRQRLGSCGFEGI